VLYNPYIRYETTSVNLSNNMLAPTFPLQAGIRFHSYPNEKPALLTTSRLYGTTKIRLSIENIKVTDKDTVYSFWDTTLSNGYNDFTVIDHRGRMLFESSWNDWEVRWKKQRGGLYTIIINIESSTPWTLPIFGSYTFVGNNLLSHDLNSPTLSFGTGGYLEDNNSTNVLRSNGYALALEGSSGSVQIAATSPVGYRSRTHNGSISIFFQFKACEITDDFYLFEIKSSDNTHIRIVHGDDKIYAEINNVELRKGSASYTSLTQQTWYDVAYSFDANNNNYYLYITESGVSSFNDFLDGKTDVDENINTYMSSSQYPSRVKWQEINLIKELTTTGVYDYDYCYLQNLFIFDGFLTATEFNTMRRLCYMWNNKTTYYPK